MEWDVVAVTFGVLALIGIIGGFLLGRAIGRDD